MSAGGPSKAAERARRLKATARALRVSEDEVLRLRRRYPGACKAAKHLPKPRRDERVAAALGLTVTQLEVFRRAESGGTASITQAKNKTNNTNRNKSNAERRRTATRIPGPLGPIPPTRKRSAPSSAMSIVQKRTPVYRQPPSVPVCGSCGRPIKPTGKCGCL